MPTSIAESVLKAARRMSRRLKGLSFSEPVACVYNPLEYAYAAHAEYVERFGNTEKKVLLLGMNPGPYGMAQTGVPFGEVAAVRDWMGIETKIKKPKSEHPKRPIQGFDCERSEVSGSRLWGLFAERFPKPEGFFKAHFVLNYCPLVFMEASGKNLTPDKLPAAETEELIRACDEHLQTLVKLFQPDWLLGVGKFAAKRATLALKDFSGTPASFQIGDILHPSPASPAANRGWAPQATRQMIKLGVWSK